MLSSIAAKSLNSFSRHIQLHLSVFLPPSMLITPPTARRTASSWLCQLGRPWRWQHARHAERSARIRPLWAAAAPADARCELPSARQAPPWQQVASGPLGGFLPAWHQHSLTPPSHSDSSHHRCRNPREHQHNSSWECYISVCCFTALARLPQLFCWCYCWPVCVCV